MTPGGVEPPASASAERRSRSTELRDREEAAGLEPARAGVRPTLRCSGPVPYQLGGASVKTSSNKFNFQSCELRVYFLLKYFLRSDGEILAPNFRARVDGRSNRLRDTRIPSAAAASAKKPSSKAGRAHVSLRSPGTVHRRHSRPDGPLLAWIAARGRGAHAPRLRDEERVCGCQTAKKSGPAANLRVHGLPAPRRVLRFSRDFGSGRAAPAESGK